MERLHHPRTLEKVRNNAVKEIAYYKKIKSPVGQLTIIASEKALVGLHWGRELEQNPDCIFREDLEKSKVENILQKVGSLKGVADISKAVFNKKFEMSTTWSFIGWVLIFVAFLTLINFVVWIIRSKDKAIKDEEKPAEQKK